MASVIATINRTVVFTDAVEARATAKIIDAILSGREGFGGVNLHDAATGRSIPVDVETVDKSKSVTGGQEVAAVSGKFICIFARQFPAHATVALEGADQVLDYANYEENADGSKQVTFDSLAFLNYLKSLNFTIDGVALDEADLADMVVAVAGIYASEEAESAVQFALNKARKGR